jgi:hypothetical protein
MARQQNGDGLSQAEAAVANAAELYEMRYLKGGRFQKQMYRSFTEAQSAASMSGDEKATITAVGEQGQKVAIGRNDWQRWQSHFA